MSLRHIDLQTEITLRVTVHGAVLLASKGGFHYLDISRIETTEGNDLLGLLPTEVMFGLQDQVCAQAQIDERACAEKV